MARRKGITRSSKYIAVSVAAVGDSCGVFATWIRLSGVQWWSIWYFRMSPLETVANRLKHPKTLKAISSQSTNQNRINSSCRFRSCNLREFARDRSKNEWRCARPYGRAHRFAWYGILFRFQCRFNVVSDSGLGPAPRAPTISHPNQLNRQSTSTQVMTSSFIGAVNISVSTVCRLVSMRRHSKINCVDRNSQGSTDRYRAPMTNCTIGTSIGFFFFFGLNRAFVVTEWQTQTNRNRHKGAHWLRRIDKNSQMIHSKDRSNRQRRLSLFSRFGYSNFTSTIPHRIATHIASLRLLTRYRRQHI